MMARATRNGWSLLGIVLIALLSIAASCFGYDRSGAKTYGVYWGEDPATGGDRVNPKYQYFSVDCANFISQCVIAGDVRFRSIQWGLGNDNTFNPGFSVPELETGKDTTWINDSDMKNYSRTIPAADDLPRSIKHRRHSLFRETLFPKPSDTRRAVNHQ